MSGEDQLQTDCSVEVAAHLAGVSAARVRSLVRSGLIRAAVVERGRPMFSDTELARLRKIKRLTNDLGVNLAGVEVILRLTDELSASREDQWQC